MQTTLTRIFIVFESESNGLSQNWEGISRKFKRFFCPKTGGLQKKKGLHRNWDWFFGRNRKFKRFFRPYHDLVLHNFGTQFPMGGLFSIFHQKSASKAPKTCDFAYFTSQWRGLEPPPPPAPPRYVTDHKHTEKNIIVINTYFGVKALIFLRNLIIVRKIVECFSVSLDSFLTGKAQEIGISWAPRRWHGPLRVVYGSFYNSTKSSVLSFLLLDANELLTNSWNPLNFYDL